MKIKITTILVCVFATLSSNAQVLCIECYNQNDSISSGVSNLITNGGFENNTCIPNYNAHSFCPNSSHFDCAIANWLCTNGGSQTYAHIIDTTFSSAATSIVVEGAQAVYFGNAVARTCSIISNPFSDSCLINQGCTVTGTPVGFPINNDTTYGGAAGLSLQQTVTGLTPGNTYVLEFWAGGEKGYTVNGLFAVDVGFGNILLRDNITPQTTGIGTRYIIEFNATATSHTIKFTNWGHIDYPHGTELVLDDVRLYTLAELNASVPHCTLGTDNTAFQNEEDIFPNPFTNELNVKTNRNQLSEIILYDLSSRKLLQQTFTNTTIINTEQLAKGMYLYTVRNRNGIIKNGKVIKQ